MKLLVFTILLLISSAAPNLRAQDFYATENVKIFREGRDREFRNPQMSPLKPEDVKSFDGLNYYPVDQNFRVTADFTATPGEQLFWMPTSSGRSRKYSKVGVLSFKLGGKSYALNAYQSEAILTAAPEKLKDYQKLLFVPFRDLTSGAETYGVGRYLSIYPPKNDAKTLVVDFNLAYNPSCAYGNESFSCPIPPKDNFLQTEIRAGEKSYLIKKEITR